MPNNSRGLARILIKAASRSHNKTIAEGAAMLSILDDAWSGNTAGADPSIAGNRPVFANTGEAHLATPPPATAEDLWRGATSAPAGRRPDPPTPRSEMPGMPRDAAFQAALQAERQGHETRMAIIRNIR